MDLADIVVAIGSRQAVGDADLEAIEDHFNMEGAARQDGDLTCDGRTDHLDYLAWKGDVGNSVPGLVPEPATLLLLALGTCPALLRRRNRARKRCGPMVARDHAWRCWRR